MALKVKNSTGQSIPLILPNSKGGTEIVLGPHKTVILALKAPTPQMVNLKAKGKIRIS